MVSALIFQTVSLGEGFSEGNATGKRIDEQLTVTLSVTAVGNGTVVAHLLEPGGEQMTLAMADIGGGRFQGVFDSRPIDLVVVFEGVGFGGRSVQSDPVRLTEIGLDPVLLSIPVFPRLDEEPGGDYGRWVWLALAAGAAALALVAVAFLPKRREPDEPAESAA